MLKYAPITMIEAEQMVRRVRTLPTNGELVGTIGQEVTPMQVVGRSRQSAGYELLPASKLLGVATDAVQEYMVVQPGEVVSPGMVLCRKRPFRKITSPIEGRIYGVYNGQIVLERPFIWHELRSLLRGRIVNQTPPHSVTIETVGTIIQASWGSGKEGFGRLKLLSETPDGVLDSSHLSNSLARHILAAGRLVDSAVLEQAAQLDVTGIIVGSASAHLYQHMQAAPFPILLIDGFGEQGMIEPAFTLLQTAENRETTLFAQDKERQRPEAIIASLNNNAAPHVETAKPLAVGQTVRLTRKPYEQAIGQIIKLYAQTQALDTGLYAPGAAVKLANGTVVFVPDANLDIIQYG